MSCSHSDMDVNMDSKSAASSRCCLPLKYLTLFANCPLPPFACCRQMLLPKILMDTYTHTPHTNTHTRTRMLTSDSTNSHAMRTANNNNQTPFCASVRYEVNSATDCTYKYSISSNLTWVITRWQHSCHKRKHLAVAYAVPSCCLVSLMWQLVPHLRQNN